MKKQEIEKIIAELPPEVIAEIGRRAKADAAKKAGATKSPAKSAAARANGKKGGRPKYTTRMITDTASHVASNPLPNGWRLEHIYYSDDHYLVWVDPDGDERGWTQADPDGLSPIGSDDHWESACAAALRGTTQEFEQHFWALLQ